VGTVGTPNGLSTPAVIDLDGNGTADYAYAGDLQGNVWKFDLTSAAAGSWNVAYSGTPVYQARDASSNPQPITTAIEVTRHPGNGLMLLFGTGQYIQTTDVAATAVQSLYGIRENGAVVASRAALVQQFVTETVAAGANTYRAVTSNPVNYAVNSGWYLDLPTAGERVVVDPILRHGRFIVPTTIPSADPCATGGYSWLMELDYLGGGRPVKPLFDVNLDGEVNSSDVVAFTTAQHAAGLQIGAIMSSPSVVRFNDGSGEILFGNRSDGGLQPVDNPGEPLATRRSSWRQIF
jgi:type IV pilus assembly protein PilY1